MATPSVCKIDGCDKAPYAFDLCNKHYQRQRRHGSAEAGRTENGEHLRYMLAHMWDDCPKWPFPRPADGYGRINYQGKRSKLVHRTVCEIANGPPPTPYHEAAHSCGKGHEGCFGAGCLSWKTRVENVADSVEHGTWNHGERVNFARLTREQALTIWQRRPVEGRYGPATVIAAEFGVSPETVVAIWDQRSWAWLTNGAANDRAMGGRTA